LFLYYISIIIIVFSNVLYHVSQKSTSKKINPFFALLVTYLTAALITGIALIVCRSDKFESNSFKDLKWTSFTLGLAIVGLEIGYLLAYRSGWNISIGSLIANTTLAILLVPIGILIYSESITITKILGIFFSMVGLLLLYLK